VVNIQANKMKLIQKLEALSKQSLLSKYMDTPSMREIELVKIAEICYSLNQLNIFGLIEIRIKNHHSAI